MKNEEKKALELPKDLSFAAGLSCNDCVSVAPGRGEQIWCERYKQYYYPSAALECKYHEPKY